MSLTRQWQMIFLLWFVWAPDLSICEIMIPADQKAHVGRFSYWNALNKAVLLLDPPNRSALSKVLDEMSSSVPDQFIRAMHTSLRMWNSSGLTICEKDLASIVAEIIKRKTSGLAWLDSIGRPAPGLLGGALFWPGNYDLCLSLNENIFPTFSNRSSKYCSVFFDLPLPENVPQLSIFGITTGFCSPRSCSDEFVLDKLRMLSSRLPLKLNEKATYCHTDPWDIHKDSWFWAPVVIFILFGILLICSSLLEFHCWWIWRSDRISPSELTPILTGLVEADGMPISSTSSTEVDQSLLDDSVTPQLIIQYADFRMKFMDKRNLTIRILSVFSLPYNSWKLCSTPVSAQPFNHPLDFLDGIRFLTMVWIVFGHCVLFSLYTANNMLIYAQGNARRWTFQAIVGATVSVDTFFMMSGLLTAYLTLPRYRSIHGWCNHAKFWLLYTVRRLIRITAPYLVVMLVYTGLFNHLYDGPFYPQRPELFDAFSCRSNWWQLFWNNLVPYNEICMPWTWYLSNEVQFSIILAPIFVILSRKHALAGVLFALSLVISSIVTTFAISYFHDLPPTLFSNSFELIYIKPYTRWGTYAIGLILGWLILSGYKFPAWLSKRTVRFLTLIGLCVASVLCLSTVYGLYGVVSQNVPMLSTTVAALFNAVHRPVFILGLSIVIFLCTNSYIPIIRSFLAWNVFRIPARLTYGIYLVHPVVILFVILGSQSAILLDNLFLIMLLFAVLAISSALSFVISMLSESPFINVMKIFKF